MELSDGLVLNQALGDEGEENAQGVSVMHRLANAGSAREHLPMLDIVFGQAAEFLTEGFMHLVSSDVKVTLKSVDYTTFGDAMWTMPDESIIGIVFSPEFEGTFLAAADRNLMSLLHTLMLGGRPAEFVPGSLGEKRLTTIESRLAMRVLRLVTDRLSRAFGTVLPVNFDISRIEINPQFTSITRWSSAAVGVGLSVRLDKPFYEGRLQLIFPYGLFEPVKSSLLQVYRGERFGADLAWNEKLAQAVGQTGLALSAVIHEQTLPLSQVAAWQPGDVVTFDAGSDNDVRLVCEGQDFFEGPLGRKGKKLAVEIEKRLFGPEKDQ